MGIVDCIMGIVDWFGEGKTAELEEKTPLSELLCCPAKESEDYAFDAPAEEVAKAKNMIVVRPEPNQLQIDIDSEKQYQDFLVRLKDLGLDRLAPYGPIQFDVQPSNSGLPHRHITINLKHALTDLERVALQMALGSDPKRECLNIKRYFWIGVSDSVFFEKKKTT